MSRRRVIAGAALVAVLWWLLSSALAYAGYRGTDMWSNLMPGAGGDGLVDRYPISHYQLDYYSDISVGDVVAGNEDVSASIGQFFVRWALFVGVLLMRFVIAVFQWAFDADFVTGDKGALKPASAIVQHNYQVYAVPFLTVALVMFAGWLIAKTIKRQASEVGGAIVRVVLMVVLCVAIVNHPGETIGRAFRMVDDVSSTLATMGSGTEDTSARLFETFVYRPVAVVQFGTLRVCTGAQKDSDGFPLATNAANPPKTCHSVLHEDPDGHGDYMARFLRYPHGSDQRRDEFNALRDGAIPDQPEDASSINCPRSNCPAQTADDQAQRRAAFEIQFRDHKIDRTDSPAVDLMQQEGAGQRLAYVPFVLFGMVSGTLLLALIAVASFGAQIALIVLFYMTPFMLVVAAYPGAHGVFMAWLSWIGKALVGKAVYALLFGIVNSTSDGFMNLGGERGYLVVFFLQALLYGGVFWKRHKIFEMLTKKSTAKAAQHHEHAAVGFVGGAAAASVGAISGGFGTFAESMRHGWSSQEHSQSTEASSSTDGPSSTPATMGNQEHSQQSTEEDHVPTKTFREELNDTRARQYDDQAANPEGEPSMTEFGDRAREHSPGADPPYFHGSPDQPTEIDRPNGIASASTFEWDLDDARRERELERRE